MTCVFDASAIMKGAMDDDRDPEASDARTILPHLAARYRLRAPQLIGWEVGNVVHHKFPDAFGGTLERRGELVGSFLRELYLDTPSEEDLRRAGRLAERYDLTFYDAAYLELADRHEGFLVTEDQRLLEAGRSHLGVERSLTTANALHHIEDGIL